MISGEYDRETEYTESNVIDAIDHARQGLLAYYERDDMRICVQIKDIRKVKNKKSFHTETIHFIDMDSGESINLNLYAELFCYNARWKLLESSVTFTYKSNKR